MMIPHCTNSMITNTPTHNSKHLPTSLPLVCLTPSLSLLVFSSLYSPSSLLIFRNGAKRLGMRESESRMTWMQRDKCCLTTFWNLHLLFSNVLDFLAPYYVSKAEYALLYRCGVNRSLLAKSTNLLIFRLWRSVLTSENLLIFLSLGFVSLEMRCPISLRFCSIEKELFCWNMVFFL